MILENIQSPADVKRLDLSQMRELSGEIRQALLAKLSVRGGHCAPNLGMVEATIALHYVFNSPEDKFVFDVSHQSYTHKMLTGRAQAFLSPEHYADVTGYSEPKESEHDHFTIGHTSTSVSLACGLAKGRDLMGGNENIVAIIGDGSLSGGEALEGLDFAAELGTNLIIVVNDNQMSIAENHGGLYQNLAGLRESNGTCANNLFRAMGLDYIYVNDGNDIQALIAAFQKVKGTDHPIVVHINTIKGLGYALAEADKEAWHWHMPFDIETGATKTKPKKSVNPDAEDYSELTSRHLLKWMKEDKSICAINAATPALMGFTPDRRAQAGKQFVDVGIAEEHAVAMASGIAKAGGKPVFGAVSSFIQRAYDQISQDLCINDNPATILILMGSICSQNDVTHLCHFDIPLLSGIPNLVFLAPTNRDEYLAMLEWSINYREHPVAIRVPFCPALPAARPVPTDFSDLNKYEMVSRGKGAAIIALGTFFSMGERAAAILRERGFSATLINPRFISGIDTAMMEELKADHSLVVTIEDGAVTGGFGEKIARYFGTSDVKVRCYGARKEFVDNYNIREYLAENRLVDSMIADDIEAILKA